MKWLMNVVILVILSFLAFPQATFALPGINLTFFYLFFLFFDVGRRWRNIEYTPQLIIYKT